jgi:hypothetical protein
MFLPGVADDHLTANLSGFQVQPGDPRENVGDNFHALAVVVMDTETALPCYCHDYSSP